MRFRILALLVTCVVAIAAPSCKKTSSEPSTVGGGGLGSSSSVSIPATDGYSSSGSKFTPPTLTVTAGTTVSWNNQDVEKHTVTSDTNIWNADVSAGGSFSRKFDTKGSFPYKCTIHAGMTGTINVQ